MRAPFYYFDHRFANFELQEPLPQVPSNLCMGDHLRVPRQNLNRLRPRHARVPDGSPLEVGLGFQFETCFRTVGSGFRLAPGMPTGEL